jgi:queuine tRNA-ribosyltransferase
MREMRERIIAGSFVEYVKQFFLDQFPTKEYPKWAVDALRSVQIELF